MSDEDFDENNNNDDDVDSKEERNLMSDDMYEISPPKHQQQQQQQQKRRKNNKKKYYNNSSSSKKNGRKQSSRRKKYDSDDNDDNDSSNEEAGVNAADTASDFWSKHEYAQMYTTLKELEKFGAGISVPEFVFFGLQSAGKTSAVSQAARLPVGVMKNGTGSRCPTRFKLKFDAKQDTPFIRVNGEEMRDEQEMIEAVLVHMQQLEKADKFSNNVLEIRIDWKFAPELTFVDLPGMITNPDKKYHSDRLQLEKITGHYLNQRKHGRYQYMPVLVKEALEEENDTGGVENIVDRVIKQYRDPDGCTIKRYNWRDDTLYIVNKFDKLLNVGSAKELIRNMKRHEVGKGRTVITMLNPNEEMTGNMSYSDLKQFVRRVPNAEQGRWQGVFANFSTDEDTPALKRLCLEMCGVGRMNVFVVDKMVQIVQGILPDIERVLDQTEQEKKKELESIRRQIANCDPIRLKTAVTKFNNSFLNYLRSFYVGFLFHKLEQAPNLPNSKRLTWAQEMMQFHENADVFNDRLPENENCEHVQLWRKNGYERSANMMLELLRRATDTRGRDSLSVSIAMPLIGGPSLKRILDVWSAMVAFMPFPVFTNEDIHNAKHVFNETKQASMWSSIRSIVLQSVEHFVQACYWLAEMTRFRLKRNADLIFEYTIIGEFSSNSGVYGGITNVMNQRNEMEGNGNGNNNNRGRNNASNNSYLSPRMLQLLRRGLESYKAMVDIIIDEFIAISQVVPGDHAQILDKMFCEQNINLGKFINMVLHEKHDQLEYQNNAQTRIARKRAAAAATAKKRLDMHDEINDNNNQTNIITANNADDDEFVDAEEYEDEDGIEDDGQQDNNSPRRVIFDNNNNGKQLQSDSEPESDPEHESQRSEPGEHFATFADILYYRNVLGREVGHSVVFNDMEFNVDTIRTLAHAFWVGIKFMCSRDIQQKFAHRIMSVIKQQKWKNDRIVNAVQCGVQRRVLEECMEKLMSLTGIARSVVEELVKNSSRIPIPKDISQMESGELSKIYGVDRDELVKKQEAKLDELNSFVLLKRETMIKITQIRKG